MKILKAIGIYPETECYHLPEAVWLDSEIESISPWHNKASHLVGCSSRSISSCKVNKVEIKKAVEEFYGVNVETVRTAIVPAKFQTKYTKAGLVRGRKPAYKKALVKVVSGETIDLYGNI